MTQQTFEQIKAAHQRAEDSTKGAGEWLADFAADAHEHRGILIKEIERLRERELELLGALEGERHLRSQLGEALGKLRQSATSSPSP
jgi:hypothetical protein